MGLKSRSDSCIVCGVLAAAGLFFVLIGCLAGRLQAQMQAEEKAGGNSKCYVCHAGMKTEEITTGHLAADVTCDKCHGSSIEHMQDEMLMTEPDLLFGRREVIRMCMSCHNGHEKPEAVEAFRKEWAGRMRPNGRTIGADSVCTDCHGTHNIANQTGREAEAEQQAQWISAFNGSDLTGWRASGSASWNVKGGRLIGTPPSGTESETLWSEAEYEDYLLVVTFRAAWPIHAGIEVRGGESKPGPRIEIFQSDKRPQPSWRPQAFTGSVLAPGSGLILVNLRGDLLDRDGWNTISAKLEADRVQVWLNGEEVGAVRTGGPTKGKIGLYIEKQAAGEAAEFCVREVQIQKLNPGKSAATERK